MLSHCSASMRRVETYSPQTLTLKRLFFSPPLPPPLSGGLELLFDGKRKLEVAIPTEELRLGELVQWIRTNLVKERHEMFSTGDSVRPGVLVLVNDVDWELEGKGDYRVENGDCIAFISTLHGG